MYHAIKSHITELIALLPIVMTIAGCTNYQPDDELTRVSKPVVEAWIDDGGFPWVIFTQSITPDNGNQPLDKTVIRWGRVSITDGETTEVLTAQVDRNVFPPFSYRGTTMRGRLGATYTITAEYGGYTATATATIPAHAPIIEHIDFTPVEGTPDMSAAQLHYSTMGITSHPNLVIFVKVVGKDLRRYVALMGIPNAVPNTAGQVTPLFRGRNQDRVNEIYEPHFRSGDEVEVTLANVDDAVYSFWRAYIDRTSLGNSMFFDFTEAITGNVTNGYGCFTASAAHTIRVVVP